MSNIVAVSPIENFEISQTGEMLVISADTDIHQVKTMWKSLEKKCTGAIYQNFDWIRIAYETLERSHQPLIIHGNIGSGRTFIIPLVVVDGIFKTVRWPGGKHANICCGIYSRSFLENVDEKIMKQIISFISKEVSGTALLQLYSQPKKIGQFRNPMLLLPNQDSQNILFEISLEQGLDGVLNAGNGKRKRQLFRKQSRVAEELGGFELVSPETPAEIKAALELFYLSLIHI